ncbi:MAG: malonyl-ACP O-methyltransferase BioC [Prevotellaceae bacterium]|jgi:malonyl-ACP O-methyltransferase BioC|nr:malonyl-ACP O-methyltransferase BioC [Prevotellaceae bacterium]
MKQHNKPLIAQRFARARNSYTREARVQQQMAEKMLRLLLTHTAARPLRRVVEFGCGTGSYSRLLQQALHPDRLLLNDLCPEMEECVAPLLKMPTTRFVPGDAETLTFPADTDAITSCATLQWFDAPEQFFGRCHHCLTADGYLAFSTFGHRNMQEVRTTTGNGLDYLSMDELNDLLTSSCYTLLHAEEETVTLSFSTPTDVLRHLQQTGVTGTEKVVWTRGRLQQFTDRYRQQFGNPETGEVALTYHPIYIIAQKRTR